LESGLSRERPFLVVAPGCDTDQPDEKPGAGVAARAGASLMLTDDEGVRVGLLQLLVANKTRHSRILGGRFTAGLSVFAMTL